MIRLRLNFSVIFEGYTRGAKHRLDVKMPKGVLSEPIFSGPDDCSDLVQFFKCMTYKDISHHLHETVRNGHAYADATECELQRVLTATNRERVR